MFCWVGILYEFNEMGRSQNVTFVLPVIVISTSKKEAENEIE